jgi:hypothetical protein
VSATALRLAVLALAGVTVFGSGLWLTRSGWPFSTLIVTIHKLVALAAVVFVGALTFQAVRAAPLSLSEWAAVVTAGLACVAAIASGGVVSALQEPPPAVRWAHRVVSWLAGVSVAVSVHLLMTRV